MHPMGPVLAPGMTVAQAVGLAMSGHAGLLPVTDPSLRLLAVVPAASLASALRWDPQAKIDSLVRHDFEVITADASLAEAAAIVRTSAQEIFPVVNPAGQLVGWVAREEVAKALG
jgi:Mg/Co/Ni transporter MgtE